MYEPRDYRTTLSSDLKYQKLAVNQSDLLIGLKPEAWAKLDADALYTVLYTAWQEVEDYILQDQEFFTTHQTYAVGPDAPPLAQAMAWAGQQAKVGPMAAVAGAIANVVGEYLSRFTDEIIIENGGDIYLNSNIERIIGVFAGESRFSNRIAIKIAPQGRPLGVCTSSGTVGHSFSYGKADAAVIIGANPAVVDATATATANLVQTAKDLNQALNFAKSIPGIIGALVIIGEDMGLWGKISIEPIK